MYEDDPMNLATVAWKKLSNRPTERKYADVIANGNKNPRETIATG